MRHETIFRLLGLYLDMRLWDSYGAVHDRSLEYFNNHLGTQHGYLPYLWQFVGALLEFSAITSLLQRWWRQLWNIFFNALKGAGTRLIQWAKVAHLTWQQSHVVRHPRASPWNFYDHHSAISGRPSSVLPWVLHHRLPGYRKSVGKYGRPIWPARAFRKMGTPYWSCPFLHVALLDYASRAHEIEICLSSVVRPSVSQLSLNLVHRCLLNFSCCFPWSIRSDVLAFWKKNLILTIFCIVFLNLGHYGSKNFKTILLLQIAAKTFQPVLDFPLNGPSKVR